MGKKNEGFKQREKKQKKKQKKKTTWTGGSMLFTLVKFF
jgi:hypothetical protein